MDYPMFYSFNMSILSHSNISSIFLGKTVDFNEGSASADFLAQSGLILVHTNENTTLLYRWECLNDYKSTMGSFTALATQVKMTDQKIMFTNDKFPQFTVCVPIESKTTTILMKIQSTARQKLLQRRALAFAMASHCRLGDSVAASLGRVLDEPSILMMILGVPF